MFRPAVLFVRCSLFIAFIFAASACKTPPPLSNMNETSNYASQSYRAKGQDHRIKFLIFHYTTLDDAHSLEVLTQQNVSAHYLIQQHPLRRRGKPVVLQLVEEKERAWHAGVSAWNGRKSLNDTSIGIEIVNLGYTLDADNVLAWYPYSTEQIATLAQLSLDIIRRYQIPPENVLGHSDIAPLRKKDPGKLFPWEKLARLGIGAWPDETTVQKYLAGRPKYAETSLLILQQTLKKYGYDDMPLSGQWDDESKKIITAFQMHFRPADISGRADAETDALAKALLEKYRGVVSAIE